MAATDEVFFWRQNREIGNFGDALTLVYLARLFDGPCLHPGATVHLVGSVITVGRLEAVRVKAREAGATAGKALFWGCGRKDDAPLPPDLLSQCSFLGVRGVLSRKALGLPLSTPLGDSAFLLPRFYRPQYDPVASGKVLWIPHVNQADPVPQELEHCPDHLVLRPGIPNTAAACERLIDAIVSSRFVMANAMHAAVVALAYGVPFAFWSGSGIDVPFKWRDLTSALDLDLDFHRSFPEALAAYDRTRPDHAFAQFDTDPLLRLAPYALRDGALEPGT